MGRVDIVAYAKFPETHAAIEDTTRILSKSALNPDFVSEHHRLFVTPSRRFIIKESIMRYYCPISINSS